ncbi:hypothetical protein MKP08_13450 [Erythrobacter sp. LQ02-29]|uniref:hypothetical protein n=1 Tax=Erythrobacter sp. LQ02-29 TaxID=2920384 RepID=UPI001F4E831C|nr:hypothetical protein [Erythrobacter sp. LQ02-29]MCP9223749.1 hypothetical protein [Erythrobacter sp. LQ02-29]
MSKRIEQQLLQGNAQIVAPPHAPTVVDRSFELPRRLYMATVGLYLGFLGVMATGFASPQLAIPMAIFALFIVAGFAVPTIWTRLAPDESRTPALRWRQFGDRGIMTATGRLKARDATIQMLILPVLIVAWGLTVVTIAALV